MPAQDPAWYQRPSTMLDPQVAAVFKGALVSCSLSGIPDSVSEL